MLVPGERIHFIITKGTLRLRNIFQQALIIGRFDGELCIKALISEAARSEGVCW
jgi:hypothetical protein